MDRGHPGCCGCMRRRTAARVVAVFSLFLSIVFIFFTFLIFGILGIFGVIFSILLMIAVFAYQPKRGFVLAFLIYTIVVLVAAIAVLIFGMAIVNNETYSNPSTGYTIITLGAVSFILSAWFGYIIWDFYRHLEPATQFAPQQAIYVVQGQPVFFGKRQPGVVLSYAPSAQPPQPLQPVYYDTQGQQQPQQWQSPHIQPPHHASAPPPYESLT